MSPLAALLLYFWLVTWHDEWAIEATVPATCSLVPELSLVNGNLDEWNVFIGSGVNTTGKPANATRLLSNGGQTGLIWNKNPFRLSEFYMEVTVNFSRLDGDGYALIFGNPQGFANSTNPANYYGIINADFTGLYILASPYMSYVYGVLMKSASAENVFASVSPQSVFRNSPYSAWQNGAILNKLNATPSADGTTQSLNFDICSAADTNCNRVATASNLSQALPKFPAPGLFFGIGAYSGGYAETVDVFGVKIYDCSPKTTTSSTSTTSTKTTSTITTAKLTASPAPTVAQVEINGTIDATFLTTQIQKLGTLPTQQLEAAIPWVREMSQLKTLATNLVKECDDFAPIRAAPPPSNKSAVTLVKPLFAIDRLVEIDTVNQVATVVGNILLSWSVTTCPVASKDAFTMRDPELVYVAKTSDIWTPGFRFLNGATSSSVYMQDSDDFGEDLTTVLSKSANSPNRTLDFYWLKDGTFSSSCELDLTRFPFDKQICFFSFSMMRSTALVAFNEPIFFVPETLSVGSEWQYQGRQMLLGTLRYNGQTTSTVHFCLAVKRNPLFYITNLVIPSAVLGTVEIGSFFLPMDYADRPTLSTTILLAITVTQSAVTENVPKTPQRILLADYTMGLSWLCGGCALYQLLVCWYARWQVEKTNGAALSKCGILRILDWIITGLVCAAFAAIHIYFCAVGMA